MKRIVVLIPFLFWVASVVAQDCEALFQEAYASLKKASLQPTHGLMMKYEVNVLAVTGEQYTDVINLQMKGGRFKITSGDFTLYQDDKTMVVIQPKAETIFVTKPSGMDKNKLQEMMALQDSLARYMTIKKCSNVSDSRIADGKPCRKMDFMLPANIEKRMGVSAVTYWIEESTRIMRKVQIIYKKRSEQPLARVDFDFREMVVDYKSQPFDGTALSKVMKGKSNPKPEYARYKIIDKR
ncbi:hypothetical protein [Chryseolinea soli]|uniref:DUF4412 domain-containing protein n=1 Tax=Chryseolinea soli TaxID=2321403 RepID=A0A385SFM9_9BACT|nr:hypothetical protein [Chryseolinea soli]AYB29196.1 hypothetical protein D4L85_00735 [Chryseolinea soli]